MRLVLIETADLTVEGRGEMSLAGKTRFVIGRDAQADWVLRDPAKRISAIHCEISFDGSRYVLQDLSTNGTFVNNSENRLEQPHPLQDGDVIGLGPYVIKAMTTGSMNTVAPPPAVQLGAPPLPSRTNALRGDPAAILLAAGSPPAKTDTQGSSGSGDTFTSVTRIRPAPRPGQSPLEVIGKVEAPPETPTPIIAAPAVAPAPPAVTWHAEPATAEVAADVEPNVLLEPLGLPAGSLAEIDGAVLARRLALLTRELANGLKDVLEETARNRRDIGSRKRRLPRGQLGNVLKFSPDASEALLILLQMDPAAAAAEINQSITEIKRHQQALISSSIAAARNLGEDLSPTALRAASPAIGRELERKARLWDMYGALWQSGNTDWASGLVESFKLAMAVQYDAESDG